MKTQKILIVTFIIIAFLSAINVLNGQWVKRYTGIVTNSYDVANAIVLDNSGNCYVTGYSNDQIATVAYKPNGDLLWLTPPRYGSGNTGDNVGNSIAIDLYSTGGPYIYVTGKTKTASNGFDYVTIKYSSSGIQLWVQTYDGTGSDDIANRIVVDQNDGSVYVTGQSTGSGTGYDYVTLKYSPSGGPPVWVARYTNNNASNSDDIAKSLTVAGGNIFVTGSSYKTSLDIVTVAYDNNGTQSWVARYETQYDDWGNDIAADAQHTCVFVTGASESSTNTTEKFTTIKYDFSGVQQWVANNQYGEGNAIALYRRSCGVYIPCYTVDLFVTGYELSIGYRVGLTIKYNENSNNQTGIAGVTNGVSFLKKLAIDASENVYVSGDLLPNGLFGIHSYLTIKYYPSLNQSYWSQVYGNGYDCEVSDIKVDPTGNSYVSGFSFDPSTVVDYLTIKYTPSGTLGPFRLILPNSQHQPDIPETFALNQNYPNPFNPSTQIKYDLPNDEFVTIKVFDLLGQQVATLINNELKSAGRYSVPFDGSYLSSGVYIYKIWAGKYSDMKKMVLVK